MFIKLSENRQRRVDIRNGIKVEKKCRKRKKTIKFPTEKFRLWGERSGLKFTQPIRGYEMFRFHFQGRVGIIFKTGKFNGVYTDFLVNKFFEDLDEMVFESDNYYRNYVRTKTCKKIVYCNKKHIKNGTFRNGNKKKSKGHDSKNALVW